MLFKTKLITIAFLALLSKSANGQIELLSEDFSSGIPSSWAIVSNDTLTPHPDVSEFTDGWISYIDDTDTVAASTSFYDPSGQSEDYLILPKQSLLAFTKLKWRSRSVDPSYPESYYVLVSTTDSLIGSFTDTILTVVDENPSWQWHSIHLDTLGFASEDVFIAFRNFTDDGFILFLDDVLVESDDNATNEEFNEITLSIYPNPAQNTLNVILKEDYFKNLIVKDLSGKIILESYSSTIDISAFPSGYYLIDVFTNSGVVRDRFLKQ